VYVEQISIFFLTSGFPPPRHPTLIRAPRYAVLTHNGPYIQAGAKKKGWFSSGSETQEMLLARLEASAVAGVTELLTAILKFLKMNAKGYLAGLLAIRRAYKRLASVSKEFEKWQEKGIQGVAAASTISP
jgi:hypothetical protein